MFKDMYPDICEVVAFNTLSEYYWRRIEFDYAMNDMVAIQPQVREIFPAFSPYDYSSPGHVQGFGNPHV